MYTVQIINAEVVYVVGNLFTVVCNSNVDFKKEVTYVNVRGGYNTEDRGRLFHKLKFEQKINKGSEYYYTFEITGSEGHPEIKVGNKVTIQPFNTSLPIISKCDSESKRITFKVENSGLYNLQTEYVIRSDCLDKYVEGTAKCVGKDNNKTDGPTITFELSDEDYGKFSEKYHCKFYFAEKGWVKNGEWFRFKKSKSVKKRAKTPKRSKARKNVKSVKSVKNVKSLKKRAKTPKRSKARKNVKNVKNVKSVKSVKSK